MKRLVPLPLASALALIALCATACQAGESARAATSKSAAKPGIVAQGEGVSISDEALDAAAAGQLARVRQQEYEIKRAVLDRLVGEAL